MVVFKLSEDLRQYFTDEDGPEFVESSMERFIETVIGYQQDSDDEIDILEDYLEELSEILENDIYDIESLNIHLFHDMFNSSIYHYIFGSFMNWDDFELVEVDAMLGYMYDEITGEFIDITSNIPEQIKKEVNRFYEQAKYECFYEGKFDSYSAETINFRMYWLKIKNKKLARMLRKNYQERGTVYDLFDQFDFYMCNGQFIYMQYACIEANGFYEKYIESGIVSEAIVELNEILNTKRYFNPGISLVMDEALEMITDESGIISKILGILSTEKEVII